MTLITRPSTETLNKGAVDRFVKTISSESSVHWLSDNEAVDILFHSPQDLPRMKDTVAKSIKDHFDGAPIDHLLQLNQARRKKLLLSDMDSTIIEQECIDEIAHFAGLKPRISAITERAMRGELDFESALMERVGLLSNLEEQQLERVINERISLTPGARTLVQTMRASGAKTCLVSGGFTFFTEKIAEMTGFEMNRANQLEISNGFLTGKVLMPILGASAKRQSLVELTDQYNLSQDDSLAVGDGANDLEMIERAGLGIAFHAKPIVASKADGSVMHTDLTALLFMQGYKRSEFVE